MMIILLECGTFYLSFNESAAFKFRDLVVYQIQLVKDFKAIPSNRRDYIYY